MQAVHLRGEILGTTLYGLDIERDHHDVHLEMAFAPPVTIAEPARRDAIRTGARVALITTGAAPMARAAVIVPDALHAFAEGRYAWDAPGGGDTMTCGRVVRLRETPAGLAVTVSYPGGTSVVAVPANAMTIVLRRGSRDALVSPQNVFVEAVPPAGGISDVVQRAIVADGPLVLPL